MKKSKLFLCLLLMIICFASFCTFNFNKGNVLAQDEFTTITSLDQITDMQGKYILEKNEEGYSYTASIAGSFQGVLNGNGNVIKFSTTPSTNFVGTKSLFDNIGSGAVVYNLKFTSGNNSAYQVYYGTTNANELKTSYGLLANTINGATVYGIEFNNVTVNVFDNPKLIAISELNIGLLAGQISNSKISQIKITDCKIISYQTAVEETIEYNFVRSNLNVGFIAGKALSGTYFQNNLISSTRGSTKSMGLDLYIAKSEATNYNIGGIVGYFESGFITNNLIDFLHGSKSLISINFSAEDMPLNFGYVVGKTTSNIVSLYSNIVNVNNDKILSLSDEKPNVVAGTMIGYMHTTLASQDINGFITTFEGKYVGNLTNELVISTYANISKIDTENVIVSRISNNDIWHDVYTWNQDTIWHLTASAILPSLQIFETYELNFSSLDSVKTLSIENLPVATEGNNVVEASMSLVAGAEVANTSVLVPYGLNTYITTWVSNVKDFNKFFYITGLLLNGTKIYDLQTHTSLEGFVVSSENNVGDEKVSFVVSNNTAKNLGTYSVQLARKTYKLNIEVVELDVNGQKLIPGKVKSNMASDGSSNLVVEMQYGVKYTYETYDVNSDYAREADWFLNYKDTTAEEEPVFDLSTAKTNFTEKRYLEWTFTENCSLFGLGLEGDENTYFSINEYNEETNLFNVYVVFTKDVKDIEIRFKFDDDVEITEKIAEVIIDDGSVSLVYNDAGYYTTKIRYSTKTHTVTLRQLSTEYTFDGWYLNTRLSGVTGDEYGGSFEIVNDGDSNTVIMYAVFTRANDNAGANLLWLWITLACIGVLAVVAIIVIVVRKKKSGGGGSGYKKFMY